MAGVSPALELVIFDCDGVLVDSESIAAELEVEMFAEIGMPMTADEVRERFLGRTTAYTNAAIVEHLGELPDGWEARWERRYYEALQQRLRPIDGVVDALDRITCRSAWHPAAGASRSRSSSGCAGLRNGSATACSVPSRSPTASPPPTCSCSPRLHSARSRRAVRWSRTARSGSRGARAAGMLTFAYAADETMPHEQLNGARTTVFDDMRLLPGLLDATAPDGR